MIRVWIELLPGGSWLAKKTLARFDIWNTSALAPVSNYDWQAEYLDLQGGGVKQRTGTIREHVRDHGGISLVRKVLAQADMRRTDSRVSVDEKVVDLSAHLLMLVMAVEQSCPELEPGMRSLIEKSREALARSAK